MRMWTVLKQPSAWLPISMSVTALAIVLIHLLRSGVTHDADAGTSAHLWQLLMAGQTPIIGYFALNGLLENPASTLRVLALQLGAALLAMAPVFLLKL